ncbi:hypothetical protein [Lysinibacillus sp. TE18511]
MGIIDFVGYTFSGGIIILFVMEKCERVVRIIKLMFEEKIDEVVMTVKKIVPKKKEHDELEV